MTADTPMARLSLGNLFRRYAEIVSCGDRATMKLGLADLAMVAEEQRISGSASLASLSWLKHQLFPQDACASSTSSTLFALLYKFTFFVCRERGSKSLAVGTAVQAWRLLLERRFSLLDSWCGFVMRHHQRGVSEDTWQQVLEFSNTVRADLSNYDSLGAWPVLIDEFVECMTLRSKDGSACPRCDEGAQLATPQWGRGWGEEGSGAHTQAFSARRNFSDSAIDTFSGFRPPSLPHTLPSPLAGSATINLPVTVTVTSPAAVGVTSSVPTSSSVTGAGAGSGAATTTLSVTAGGGSHVLGSGSLQGRGFLTQTGRADRGEGGERVGRDSDANGSFNGFSVTPSLGGPTAESGPGRNPWARPSGAWRLGVAGHASTPATTSAVPSVSGTVGTPEQGWGEWGRERGVGGGGGERGGERGREGGGILTPAAKLSAGAKSVSSSEDSPEEPGRAPASPWCIAGRPRAPLSLTPLQLRQDPSQGGNPPSPFGSGIGEAHHRYAGAEGDLLGGADLRPVQDAFGGIHPGHQGYTEGEAAAGGTLGQGQGLGRGALGLFPCSPPQGRSFFWSARSPPGSVGKKKRALEIGDEFDLGALEDVLPGQQVQVPTEGVDLIVEQMAGLHGPAARKKARRPTD